MGRKLLIKLLSFISASVLLFSLAACDEGPADTSRPDESGKSSQSGSGQSGSEEESGGGEEIARPEGDDFIMSFGAFGDKHVPAPGESNSSTLNAAKNFEETLTYFKDEGIQTLVMVGDIADYGKYDNGYPVGEAFKEVGRIMYKVWGEKLFEKPENLMYTLGNHEFYYKIDARDTLDEWKSFCEEFQCESYFEVEGVTFLSLDPTNSSGSVSKKTKDFIREKVRESAERNPYSPIFISYHIPPADTIMRSDWECVQDGFFRTLMTEYPQIVLLTAHTHYSGRHPASINQTLATAINVGTGTYACVAPTDRTGRKYDNVVGEMVYQGDVYDEGEITGNYSSLPYAAGYNDLNEAIKVNVYTNHVEVERLDMHTGEPIAPMLSFPTAATRDDFVYTALQQKENLIVPELSEESCTITREGGRLHLKLAPANDIEENVVDSYRIEVYCDGLQRMDKNYVSDYWMHTDGCGDYNMLLVDEADKEDKSWIKKALTVKIAATDGAGNISEQIEIEVPAA